MEKLKSESRFSLKYVTLVGLLSMFMACSQKHKVEYVVPSELQNQTEAIETIDDMAEAVGDCQHAMQKAVKFAIANKGNTDSLSMGQGIKAAVTISKVMLAKKHMDEAKEKANLLREDLSVKQIRALDSVMNYLEKQIGNIDTNALGLSEEELAELEAGGDLSFGNEVEESPEKKAKAKELEAEAAYIEEQHRLHDEYLKSQGIYEEPRTSENNAVETPMWVGVAFPILVILLIAVFFIIKVKRFVKGVKRVASDVDYAKSKLKNKNF